MVLLFQNTEEAEASLKNEEAAASMDLEAREKKRKQNKHLEQSF